MPDDKDEKYPFEKYLRLEVADERKQVIEDLEKAIECFQRATAAYRRAIAAVQAGDMSAEKTAQAEGDASYKEGKEAGDRADREKAKIEGKEEAFMLYRETERGY